ncbi:MAG: hypothetical protein JW990_19815 [Thermoleophilia bacterium]|nr:hypothetical protein [Thermoleophilia bacterium]
MKPQMGTRQEGQSTAKQQSVSREEATGGSIESLGAFEARVVESLRSAATGLTGKQLEARLDDPSVDVEGTLTGLVERRVICRLNTLIPTYTLRDPNGKVNAE